ncbi:MAG: hypothetical protein A2041_04885 [Bacteroidetes bacterium GWA2_31_9b]|nr:MAG: hypothetical protein A2041_04885 [Bacteroidetes bacterium GWA2_31_9b]
MRSIFGRINTNNQILEKNIFEKGLNRLSVTTKINRDSKLFENSGFGHISFYPDQSNLFDSNNQYIILSDLRLDNRLQLIEELKISDKSISDDEILIKAFEKWGHDCPNHFLGDFAFAIWNSSTQQVFCSRDYFGVKPFYYYFDGKVFIFSSEVNAIRTQIDLNFTIDQQYIADTISIVKSDKDRTTFTEIKKLPPANYLVLNKDQIEINEYWKLIPQKIIELNDELIIEQFKDLIKKAVQCRVSEKEDIGTELSGGIDSSATTAIASQFTQIKTFSHVLPDQVLGKIYPYKDEREFIHLLTNFCTIKENHIITSEAKGFIDAINENIDYSGLINQQNFSIFSDHLYQKASEENVHILLSGFGGDEVISSKAESYRKELALSGQWEQLKNDLQGQKQNQIKVLINLTKYFLKIKFTGLFKLLYQFKSRKTWWHNKFENLAIKDSFSKKMNIEERYFSQFKKNSSLSFQEKSIERITHPHVSQRLEYCSTAARKYGIDYRYPFLDKRLIEFYLSIPINLKAKNGIGRYAIRKAIEEIVPEKICWRNDKSGATIPTVYMRLFNDREKIAEIITKAKNNSLILKYIDLDAYESWFEKLIQQSDQPKTNRNPGAFYNYFKLILFIEQNPELFI